MTENLTLKGEALGASLGGTLEAEQFLNESYRLRRNVLNGKVEFATLNAEETYRPSRTLPTTSILRMFRSLIPSRITWSSCQPGMGRTSWLSSLAAYQESVPSNWRS